MRTYIAPEYSITATQNRKPKFIPLKQTKFPSDVTMLFDAIMCTFTDVYGRFRRTHSFQQQGRWFLWRWRQHVSVKCRSIYIYICTYVYTHHNIRRHIPQVNNRHCHLLQSLWWRKYPLFSDNNLKFRFRYYGMWFLAFGGTRRPLQSTAFFPKCWKTPNDQRHTQEERNPRLHLWRSVKVSTKLCFWLNIYVCK